MVEKKEKKEANLTTEDDINSPDFSLWIHQVEETIASNKALDVLIEAVSSKNDIIKDLLTELFDLRQKANLVGKPEKDIIELKKAGLIK
jgi:hypothetical protein